MKKIVESPIQDHAGTLPSVHLFLSGQSTIYIGSINRPKIHVATHNMAHVLICDSWDIGTLVRTTRQLGEAVYTNDENVNYFDAEIKRQVVINILVQWSFAFCALINGSISETKREFGVNLIFPFRFPNFIPDYSRSNGFLLNTRGY